MNESFSLRKIFLKWDIDHVICSHSESYDTKPRKALVSLHTEDAFLLFWTGNYVIGDYSLKGADLNDFIDFDWSIDQLARFSSGYGIPGDLIYSSLDE